jgi:hypothetical protein
MLSGQKGRVNALAVCAPNQTRYLGRGAPHSYDIIVKPHMVKALGAYVEKPNARAQGRMAEFVKQQEARYPKGRTPRPLIRC